MRPLRQSLILLSTLTVLVVAIGCEKEAPQENKRNKENNAMNILKEPFGEFEGKNVDLYTLKNTNGIEVKITNYGGIVTSIKEPDKNGKFGDVVLGYDNLQDHISNNPYFGAIIGRYGNRIGNAALS